VGVVVVVVVDDAIVGMIGAGAAVGVVVAQALARVRMAIAPTIRMENSNPPAGSS
jgi:hypothetical protein